MTSGVYESIEQMLTRGDYHRSSALLDIGCGAGETVDYVYRRCGARMFGFDRDGGAIARALERNPCALLYTADAEEKTEPDGRFDGIFMKQTLSAINRQQDALYLARCALRQEGRLYLADYYLAAEEPEAMAQARRLAEQADREAALHGNCASRRVKRPSCYCVDRAFVKDALWGLLEGAGLKLLSWEDASVWPECGHLDPWEGYFFLVAGRT